MNLWKRRIDDAAKASALSTVTPAQRRAALALHALAASDRRWVLQRMPNALRRCLRALLRELDRLGIQPSASFAAAASLPDLAPVTASAANTVEATDPSSSVPIEPALLAPAQCAALAQALSSAPTALRAYALAALPAADHQAVSALLFPTSSGRREGAVIDRNASDNCCSAPSRALQDALIDYAVRNGNRQSAALDSTISRPIEATS